MKKVVRVKVSYGHSFENWEERVISIMLPYWDYFSFRKASKSGKTFFECKDISNLFKICMDTFYNQLILEYKEKGLYEKEVRLGLNISDDIPLTPFTDYEQVIAFKKSIGVSVDFV